MPFANRPRGWERTVARIIARDRGICWICGKPGATTADHLVPRSKGGGHGDDNLRAAHRTCNSRRGNRDVLPPAKGSRWGAASTPVRSAWAPRRAWNGRELIVLMGPPGSGKTTFARAYPNIVSTDVLRVMRASDVGVDADAVSDIYTAAFEAVVARLRANQTVVLDTAAVSPVVRERALRVARAFHATPRLVVFTTPLDVCLARQLDREHPAPADVVRRMHADVAAQRPILASEGWASVVERTGG